jgi:hypothetical protein
MHFFILPFLFSVIWLFSVVIQGLRNPLSHIPGPWYSRLTSLVLMYHWLRGRRAFYVQELHEKYGML